ncbi:hypothetical protein BJ742DRAFT_253282 [Cladochytrium replicatum]|nr:hypothetical protein BJ742DRAFT_253282 [Cladochytrium replicatum]
MQSNEVGLGRAQNAATHAADPLPTGQSGAHNANHYSNTQDPNIATVAQTGTGTSLVGEFLVSNEIGRGSFATVYLGRSKSSGRLVAVKSVARDKLNRKLAENLESEIRILKGIQHEHIVGLYDIVKTSRHIHLIMEYCSMGDLSGYIKKRGQVPGMMDLIVAGGNASGASVDAAYNQAMLGSIAGPWGGLNEAVVRHFLHQIVAAIEFLRSHSLIHRDLKPQNLLLAPPPQGSQPIAIPMSFPGRSHASPTNSTLDPPIIFNVLIPVIKLADFGFARTLLQQSLASTLCGSPLYMAPEILRGDRYDAKADLWSLGTVLYELVAGRPPFKAQNHVELLRKIERGEGVVRFPGDERPSASRRSTDEMSLDPRSRTAAMAIPRNALEYAATHSSPSGASSLSSATTVPPPISEDIKDLIQGLLKRNPLERMGFEELFTHPAVLQPAKLSVLGASPGSSSSQRRSVSGVTPTPVGSFNARPSHQVGDQRVPSQRGSFPPEARAGSSPKYSHGMVVNHEDEPLPSQSHRGKRQSMGRSPDVVLVGTETPFGHQPGLRQGPFSGTRADRYSTSLGSTESLGDDNNYTENNMGLSLDDYVVVEKRTVEVNWIADEVVASDKDERTGKPSSSSGLSSGRVLGTLRNNLFGTPPQTSAPLNSKQSQQQLRPKGSPALQPTPTFARQTSSRPRASTPTNQSFPPASLSSSPPQPRNDVPNVIAEDPTSLLRTLKNCTQSANLVNSLANEALAIARGARNNTAAFWVASEETLNLYLFTLGLYQFAMEIAKVIWEGRNSGSTAVVEMSSTKGLEGELSERVVWIRDRFNGCLENAEVARGWMSEAEAAWLSAQQALASARGVEFREVVPPSARTAEKIIYDRALQLSRGAVDEEVQQMSGGESGESEGSANLHLAEEMYTTAMVLLEALLIAPASGTGGGGGNISDDDRGVVESVVAKLYSRVENVQRLIEGGRATSGGGAGVGV